MTILIAVAGGALLFALGVWMPVRGEGESCGGGCLGCTESRCERSTDGGGREPAGRAR